MDTAKAKEKNRSTSWLKGLGIAGFLFFFAKGLVWIAVAIVTYCLAV